MKHRYLLLLLLLHNFQAFATGSEIDCAALEFEVQPGDTLLGRTTRYWDCCRPTCDSSAAAGSLISGSIGSSCASSHSNNNETDICAGGTAAICSDLQPWQAPENENLLFAFAAHSGSDTSCCACFEFFNSTVGGLVNKTLIVQVASCGLQGESNKDRFDLMIPMGGVGNFEGCFSQWGKEIDWGDKYKGVSDISHCEQLFDKGLPIYYGCLFRFISFGDALNPTFNYRRVQCPEVMKNTSGCSRSDDVCFPHSDFTICTDRPVYSDDSGQPLPSEQYPGHYQNGCGLSTSTSTTTTTPSMSSIADDSTSTSLTASGGVTCVTALDYYPESPLYCIDCPIPGELMEGVYKCTYEESFAECYDSANECFEAFRGFPAPEESIAAENCWTHSAYNPPTPDDCSQCPQNPTYEVGETWHCEQLNWANCFPSPEECYYGFQEMLGS